MALAAMLDPGSTVDPSRLHLIMSPFQTIPGYYSRLSHVYLDLSVCVHRTGC